VAFSVPPQQTQFQTGLGRGKPDRARETGSDRLDIQGTLTGIDRFAAGTRMGQVAERGTTLSRLPWHCSITRRRREAPEYEFESLGEAPDVTRFVTGNGYACWRNTFFLAKFTQ
jgi:hypothetical protein